MPRVPPPVPASPLGVVSWPSCLAGPWLWQRGGPGGLGMEGSREGALYLGLSIQGVQRDPRQARPRVRADTCWRGGGQRLAGTPRGWRRAVLPLALSGRLIFKALCSGVVAWGRLDPALLVPLSRSCGGHRVPPPLTVPATLSH